MIGSFLDSDKALVPAVFAIIVLLSAEALWQLVKGRNKKVWLYRILRMMFTMSVITRLMRIMVVIGK